MPKPQGRTSSLTIVMYHYVRPLSETPYPEIKGLDLSLFEGQLGYLSKHYSPVSMEQVVASIDGDDALPANPVLLTFDDGYRDHHAYVLPMLEKYNIKGAFYPPARTALDRALLDVNKVHFILAATQDTDALISHIETAIEAENAESCRSIADLRNTYFKPQGFDTADVIYVKRLLQQALPEELRNKITDDLFRKFVTTDVKSFADDLYCGTQELHELLAAGHHIGSHGEQHYWLSKLTPEKQREDIETSLRLCDALNQPRDGFTFCYPYGDFDQATIGILKDLNCAAALTTQVDLAHPGPDNHLILPRLDTNHLPKEVSANPNDWTRKALNA